MTKIALTGIKPTGSPHIGNYLAAIKPALSLAQDYQALYFIADYHALTTVREGARLRELSYEVAATWLALGLDPTKVIFYRQSDVPEIFELQWILSCFTAKGLLNRAHAYKAAVDKNIQAGVDPDAEVHAGLYNYPVLMAADILLFGSHVVPVGLDQKQHVEIARDIALTFNHTYGETFVIPEPLIRDEVMTITGLDGRKMSKSYNNTIPMFLAPADLKKHVMRIVSGSLRVEEPKDPDQCNIFAIYRHFASPDAIVGVRQRYQAGGLSYKEMKEALYELLDSVLALPRQRYQDLMSDKGAIDRILAEGKVRARDIAAPKLSKIRSLIGIG